MPQLSLIYQTHPARAGTAPHPGLVLLHGLGSHELDLLSLASEIDPRVYTISARAPMAYRWGGYMWYDIERHGPGLGSESIEQSLDLLRQFLHEVVEVYPIDPARLFVGGFSQGAALAGAIGLLEPDSVAGAVMVSGFLPPDPGNRYLPWKAAGHPYFQAHGTLDRVVPLQAARLTRAYLQGTPVELTYREYPIGHEVSIPELRDLAAWFSTILDSQ
jgi:phospholipase/carboxylesterase